MPPIRRDPRWRAKAKARQRTRRLRGLRRELGDSVEQARGTCHTGAKHLEREVGERAGDGHAAELERVEELDQAAVELLNRQPGRVELLAVGTELHRGVEPPRVASAVCVPGELLALVELLGRGGERRGERRELLARALVAWLAAAELLDAR